MMTPHKDSHMTTTTTTTMTTNMGFAIHQMNAQIGHGQVGGDGNGNGNGNGNGGGNVNVNGGNGNGDGMITTNNATIINENELKMVIAAEVRTQMIPVVKEIVRDVVEEVRNVMTEVVQPLCDEFREFRNNTTLLSNNFLYSMGNRGIFANNNSSCISQAIKAESCDGSAGSSSPITRSRAHAENNFGNKSQREYVREPREPRAQASTSDCAAFSFIYYNTVCLIPIATLLDPDNSTYVCQKVPKIFLGKEGGKISFLVDMKAVRLRDLTSDNLGYWTSRFAAHMKTRKYFVKDGQITGRIQQFGQVCHLLHDYDYILHRQYYCHGNTIGPAAIRKNIWYLTGKLNGGQAVGCALISYEIDDNVTVKISKLRYKSGGLNGMGVKEEKQSEEMDVNTALTPNAELQRFVDSIQPL